MTLYFCENEGRRDGDLLSKSPSLPPMHDS
jgi:hypothetical protein